MGLYIKDNLKDKCFMDLEEWFIQMEIFFKEILKMELNKDSENFLITKTSHFMWEWWKMDSFKDKGQLFTKTLCINAIGKKANQIRMEFIKKMVKL